MKDFRLPPTETQYETWRFIVRFVEANGFQPSRAEIATHFKISQASVRDRLKGLEQKGWIVITGTERALKMPDLYFVAKKKPLKDKK